MATRGVRAPDEIANLRRFEAIAIPHVDQVYRAAFHLTGHSAEAEDLTQDTFLRAFQAFSGFRGDSAKAWLMTILRNAFIDKYRQRRTQPAEVDEAALSAESVVTAGALITPGAEDQLLAAGLDEAVDRALMALPPDWRLVVVLADLEGMAYREIADITQVPIGTVMSRLHRSRKRLHHDLLSFALSAGYAAEGAP